MRFKIYLASIGNYTNDLWQHQMIINADTPHQALFAALNSAEEEDIYISELTHWSHLLKWDDNHPDADEDEWRLLWIPIPPELTVLGKET